MAEIGDFKVTEEEYLGAFRNIFERSGRALQVTSSLLREILDQRVAFYGAVQYGMDKNWHQDQAGIYQKNLIYRQVMMDEFKRSIIGPQVSITEEDLQQLFLRYNTHLRASHLYAPDRESADSLYNMVASGISFEQIASEIFESSSLRNSGGDLGFFTVDDMDVGFEAAAYSLPVGEVSTPVRTSTGFSIIKVTERLTSPLLTEYQYAQSRQNLRELAVRQKTELKRREHMDQVIDRFEFNRELMMQLWEKLEPKLDFGPSADIEMESFGSNVPDDWHSRTLGIHEGYEVTVGAFLQEVFFTPFESREKIRSWRQFQNLVEGVAYRSYAMHAYLNSHAYDEETVALSVENTFQNYLNRRLTATLRDELVITDDIKRAEFERNRGDYIHPREVNLAELAVRDMEIAEEAYLAIKNGMPFREALAKYGFDEEAKLVDGEIGYTPVTHFGSIAPSLSGIQPGDIAGPFEMRSDVVFLFKCLGVREAHAMTYEEAKPVILENLTGEHIAKKRRQAISETLERHDAVIHYNRIDDVKLQL